MVSNKNSLLLLSQTNILGVTYDPRYTHDSQHLLAYEYWNEQKETGEGSGSDCDEKYAPIEHKHVCQDIIDLR